MSAYQLPATETWPGASGITEHVVLSRLVGFLSRRWMMDILHVLRRDSRIRFGALRRALPGSISARVLSNTLRSMEEAHIVRRLDLRESRPHVVYELTDSGKELAIALHAAGRLASRLTVTTMLTGAKT
jgi:DNA-binding HxlR family transcriptional regulator